MEHEAADVLERPFVHYVGNQPDAGPANTSTGCGRLIRTCVGLPCSIAWACRREPAMSLKEYSWRKREIENYLCSRDVLPELGAVGVFPCSYRAWRRR